MTPSYKSHRRVTRIAQRRKMLLRVLLILVITCLFEYCDAQAPAPSNDGLLLPVALGFLLKIVLVVLGGMIKLLFLGLTSLGTSGVALLLGLLFLKNNGLSVPPWPAPHHPPPPGWHDRGDWLPYRQKRIGYGYGYGYGGGYHRNGKHLKQTLDFYKPQMEEHLSVYPVPVATVIDPVDGPHYKPLVEQRTPKMMVKDTESAPIAQGNTFKKRVNELPQTHVLAN